MRTHARRLDTELYERGYGKDAADIARSAIKYAKDKVRRGGVNFFQFTNFIYLFFVSCRGALMLFWLILPEECKTTAPLCVLWENWCK